MEVEYEFELAGLKFIPASDPVWPLGEQDETIYVNPMAEKAKVEDMHRYNPASADALRRARAKE